MATSYATYVDNRPDDQKYNYAETGRNTNTRTISGIKTLAFSRYNPDPSKFSLQIVKADPAYGSPSNSGWAWVSNDGRAFAAPPPARKGRHKSHAEDARTASKPDTVRVQENREVLDLDLGDDFGFMDGGASPGDNWFLQETSDPRTPTGWVYVNPTTGEVKQAAYQSKDPNEGLSQADTARTKSGKQVASGSELAEPVRTRQSTQVRRQSQARQRTLAAPDTSRRSGTILGE